ncbi:MAG: hypothetical protein AB7S26_03145 [Sandaracinaceae bacterium]
MDDSVSAVVGRLIDVLEPSGVTYAFGDAIALAAWSEPRATADVDVILWLDDSRMDEAVRLVQSAGVALDPATAKREAQARGMFAGMVGATRVDVFVPSIPFYAEAERRRVRTEIVGRDTWIHSAEVLAVFKLLFFRPKDLIDVERMVAVRGGEFDRPFVRAALVDMLEEDERIAAFDGLCERADRRG